MHKNLRKEKLEELLLKILEKTIKKYKLYQFGDTPLKRGEAGT
jgi:hypothetical protein